jgi:GH25 family lysozyme M1 (1,4-beta-N-acetylmuramidase)
MDDLESRLMFARPYGVDVSYYQTTNGTTNIINWASAKANSGIEFAIMRASYGNASADTAFASQAAAAKAAGVIVGTYHFAYPEGTDAITEANNFMNRASGYMGVGNLPPVLDMENNDQAMTNSALTTWANDFCNQIYNTIGVKPFIYCNTNWATNYLQSSVNQWPLWIANYNYNSTHQTANPPSGVWPSGTWKFFQYTSTGTISGYTSNIDRDVYNGTSAQLQAEAIVDREVTVLDGATNIADGQANAIDFGAVTQNGATISKTFTVRNDGDLLLTLSSLTVPTGYTITSTFGDTTLRSGESTTFTVRLDAATAGTKAGNIQFTCNDANEATFNFPITGVVNGLAAPSGLQVTGSTFSSVSLQWADNSASENSFKVERKIGVGGTWVQVGSTAANATSYPDTTAPGGSGIYYRVRGYDGAQYSPYSNEVYVATPVQVPPNVAATNNLLDKVSVTWDTAAGAVNYQVFRGTTNDVNLASFLVSTSQLSHDDPTAIGNVQYYYFVRGVSSLSTASVYSAGAPGLRVVDVTNPSITAGDFHFETAPQQVRISFSENVQASIDVGDITITNLADNTNVSVTGTTYDSGANIAGWSIPANPPAGNYRAVLAPAGVTDPAGNPLAAGTTVDFFILPGDVNRDRMVDTSDFNVLAGHFGVSGAVFSQGDLNLNTVVDSSDFNTLVAGFGSRLAPAASPAAAGSIFAVSAITDDDSALPI